MSAARQLPERDYLALKAATRELVKRCGGQEAAARATRVNHQSLSRYGSLEDAQNFSPVDVIADLEAEIGEPIVTRELASLAGRTLADVASGDAMAPALRLVRLIKETGEVKSALAEALADGRIDEAERLTIRREAREAIAELERLIHALGAEEGRP
ncbi:phage regulatory CII family protein [Hansschlegelia zhihuaiae]|uniref:Uncharacterized protein n=1 Tax=Hansschlegelia zhihuaiae TaxID=405005 RepID=A0A4Q0MFV6_9HYPH|nr:phage regulatory CII family protein [Hansschlegelia zhihuaiae]RXF72093.1 hypothetical protein EK403_14890 [Hansschlegelia zhihuaiae]